MRFKSKFNVGDIVQFYNHKICDNDIGKIDSISISFSYETMLKEKYKISPARIECDYSYNGVEVEINSIRKKLNKKAFEKAFAEKCANYVAENENEIILGWNYAKDFNQRKYYYVRKDWVFATKEEAEKKLAEIKGEKDE